jgi:signal transduction histidine kinase
LSGIPFNITNSIAKDAIASIPQRIEGGHQSAESQLIHEFAGLADASLLVVSLRQEVPTKGVLCFAAARPHIFTEEHEKLILFLADYMSFAILLEQQAQHSKIVEGQKQQIALAGDLLHRASNPIFSIRDWLYTIGVDDLIRMERDLPNVAEAIEMIQISVKRLLNVTYELSNLVRPVLLKPVDVNASIEAALEAVSSYSKAKNWQAQRLLAPTSPLTLADHRLQEVFRALLENAIDALPEQGRIQVITKVHDGVVITSISDNGHGIAPEHLPRIFDPFFSTKNPRKPIDGLGLFVCQRYVEDAWKGKIKVEKSEIGNGTTFVVTLPIHQLEDIYSAADR